MKKVFAVLLFVWASSSLSYAQKNVGINTPTPDPSAALDVTSTDQGVLIPRMSSTLR